jgi:hypothetical protein
MQGTIESVSFKDTNLATGTLADLTGYFYSVSAGVLFTW